MINRIIKCCIQVTIAIGFMQSGFAVNADFLPVEEAFKFRITQSENGVVADWVVAPGYKLYKEKILLTVPKGSAQIKKIDWPVATSYFDRTFNQNMLVYKKSITLPVQVVNLKEQSYLKVEYQGCADEGLCYPPVSRFYLMKPNYSGNLTELSIADVEILFSEKNSVLTDGDDSNIAQEILKSENLFKIALGFWVFGLLLSFTPCVLPMIPILSSIIVGNQKDQGLPARGFLMALAYCAGMALVYTSMGLMAGMLGEGLAAYLQQPWVLILFATMLGIFSLSMFDVIALQMPATIQNRLNQASTKLPGGKFLGVFLMGSLSALMVGPCVAGPLAGALIYISQTKNLVLGGVALFAMALGMSVPLLATGISAGKLLPKVGPWMIQVKYIFGLLLLAVALWMLTPLMSSSIVLLAWGAMAIFAAIYLDIFGVIVGNSFGLKLKKLLAIILLLIGVAEIWGAVSGGTNLLQPIGQSPTINSSGIDKLKFMRIQNLKDLDAVLAKEKKVLVDFYADWCVSCKEMEHLTFSKSSVQAASQGITLIQVDVTRNTSEDREILKRFGLFGPPAILFFDHKGQENGRMRVVGFMDHEKFSQRLIDFKKL